MVENSKLVMTFKNRIGKNVTLSIDDPKDDLTEEQIKAAKEKREPLILPHFSCHHLRHTFATRFCENETNLKVIQSVMGHANIETTMDIYAEATERKKQESMRKLSEKFDVN